MEFKEGLLATQRMCKSHTGCEGCPINIHNCPFASITRDDDIDGAVKAVEDWAATHKPKTRLDVLMERFPNVHLDKGVPQFCPRTLFGGIEGFPCSGNHCEDCWNQIAPAEYQEDKP